MINQINWTIVNQNLIAKAIGELTFEQVLTPILTDSGYMLKFSNGVSYQFSGKMTVWEYLKVKPDSIKRNNESVISAGQFFIDTQTETGMDDIILGNFLEEMHNTLYSDLIILENNKDLSVKEIAQFDGEIIQTLLNGHPKILLNKGRIGWNSTDIEKYSPESQNTFQLHWIAIKNTLLDNPVSKDLLDSSMSPEIKTKLLANLNDLNAYSVLPVHPWQWDRYGSIQFTPLLASKELISLGVAGDLYRPQISIRTLSNVSRPEEFDIKLPLTVLNTSAIRGLAANDINKGKDVSNTLRQICQGDSLLVERNTEILTEVNGTAFVHEIFKQVSKAPYRYHELLGVIWRESAHSKLATNEKAILTSSLFHVDQRGHSLIEEYIELSGLSPKEWIQKYFEVIVVPLYHLQLKYGVGMVAHGQNIILKLKNYKPSGMILKDFQGDLRLLDKLPSEGQSFFEMSGKHLTRLPAHYLIHDLITGHFVTNLRFISIVMDEAGLVCENEFYHVLANVIKDYIKDKEVNPKVDLLSPTISRVLLNRVRFNIGYSDTAQRPLPILGTELKNPLSFAREKRNI